VLRSDRWRGSLTVALLIVSLVTTALLAGMAQVTFLYHRTTAEKVLRDFARLAASEFVRRSTARLGYDGYLVLLSAAGRSLEARGLPEGLPNQLASHSDARVREASRLARRFFVAAPRAGMLVFTPVVDDATAAAWLLDKLRGRAEALEGFTVVHGVIGGVPRSFAFTSARGAGEWQAVGFEARLEELGPWLAPTLERGPLLPSFVGMGNVTNDSLRVVLRDHAAVERLRKGPQSAGVAVEVPFGSAYSGVLDGAKVELGIEPEAARRLVVGGVPQSRLGVVLLLLGLSTGLVVVALLQLRRQRALQRMREEFIAGVSHELRTPLTQIRMFAETLLLERVRSGEERRRALEIIDREARRLTHLVENVLQFSRGERGSLALAREQRPLAPLLREVVEQFQPLAAGSGARLVARLDEQASAAVDADALRQVLLNLLDNAVKYGPRDQQLTLALERAERAVRLSVEDQGPGIPAAARRRVFERYERLPRDQAKAVAGTGIGLAVVRDLVERHGGRVFVEDGAKGGARFVVELPA
jgi:signal transduction histidine kinase